MSRALRSMIVLLTATAALFASAVAIAREPVARSAGSCTFGAGYPYGYTYAISLSVKNTTCATGRNVVKHHGKVSGWRCAKKRLQTSSIQYTDRETCTSGTRRVQWVFSQNT
jgi:hypothetical protein